MVSAYGKVILAKYTTNKGMEIRIYIDSVCRVRGHCSSWIKGCFVGSVIREEWVIINSMSVLRELGLL